jgi:hypothetical protein
MFDLTPQDSVELGRFVLEGRLRPGWPIWGLTIFSWHSRTIYLLHLWVEEERGTNYLSFSTTLRYVWLLQ